MDLDTARKARYKSSDGKHWIEVRVREIQQIFDLRDPAPFRERDLNEDFVKYIVSSARDFSISVPLRLVIYVEAKESSTLTRTEITQAIYSYFSYEIELQQRDLRDFLKRSQFFLVIGMLVLMSCIVLSQTPMLKESSGLLSVLREGVIIFGWVSMWKPIESILFDWYPLYEKLRFYKKFLKTEIDVKL